MPLLIFGAIALLAFGAVWEGWVLSVLWRWFLVPLGAPALSIPAAIGVAIIVGMLTHQSSKTDDEDWAAKISAIFLGPPMMLLVGWITKQFL